MSNWSEHHRVIEEQAAEWAAHMRAHPGVPLCVAGDLNTDMGTGSRYGTKRGITMLRAAMEACGLICATDLTRMRAGLLMHPPIDHVLLPAEWASTAQVVTSWEGATADGERLSDHSGVLVEVAD